MNVAVLYGIIPGLILGFLSLRFLVLKQTDGCYTLKKKDYVIVPLVSMLCGALFAPSVMNGGYGFSDILSLGSLLFVLIVSSVMDNKSQKFLVYPVLIGILLQTVLLITSFITGGHTFFANEVLILLVEILLLFVMSFFAVFSYGDFLLLMMCALGFYFLRREFSAQALVVTAAITLVLGFIRDLLCLVMIIKERKMKMPFTMCITVGVIVALFIYL